MVDRFCVPFDIFKCQKFDKYLPLHLTAWMSKNMNDNSTQGPSSQPKPLKCDAKHNPRAPIIGTSAPGCVYPSGANPPTSQAHQDVKKENSFQITNVEVRTPTTLSDDLTVLTEVLVIPNPIAPSVREKLGLSAFAPSIAPIISTVPPTSRKIKPISGSRFQIIKTLPLLEHSTRSTAPTSPKIYSGRFKVVKFESTVPFQRGRWTCMDYLDQSVNQKSTVKKTPLRKPELLENPLEDLAVLGAETLEPSK